MRFGGVLAALFAVAAAAPASDLEAYDLEPRNAACSKGVHVIAIPGQYTTQGDMGYLKTLVMNITHAIPHSNFAQIGYPVGAVGSEVTAYAIPKLHEHIRNYSERCPKSKIVLASYSVGGMADMTVMCGSWDAGVGALPKRYASHILANVVYGDLSFKNGLHYNRGTCKTLPGKFPRAKPGECFPFGRKTHSYCDSGDQNCCSGTDPAVHFTYPQKYDLIATKFVVARWKRFRRNVKAGKVNFTKGNWVGP